MEEEKKGLKINTAQIKSTVLNFIVPLLCLALSVILALTIIIPYFKQKDIIAQEISSKEVLKSTLSSKVLLLNKLTDFQSMLDENSMLVDKVLVSEDNVPLLLDQIYQIATNTGLKVTRLNYSYGNPSTTPAGSAPASLFNEVDVSLSTDGNYDQVINVLKDTETAARILYVSSIRYTKDKEGVINTNYSILSPYLFVQSDAVTDDPIELDVSGQAFVDFINRIKALRIYEVVNPNMQVIDDEQEEKESTETPAPAVPVPEEAPKPLPLD